jgi:outer membrane protein
MKRAAQFLVVALIIGCFASNILAQDKEHMFDGFWKTERGSIVKIDGDEGIFVHTPVESWKSYIDKLIIRNIHKKDDKWIADEYIIRRVLLQGHTVESYYEKVGVVSENPGIHLDSPGQSDNSGIRLPANPPKGNAGRFGIGVRVGYGDYSDDDQTFSGGKVELESDGTFMYEVNLTYFLHEYFSLELGVDYTETDVYLNYSSGMSGKAGDLEQIPVLLTGRMHFSTNHKVTPYLGVGIGYYFNDFDSDSGSSNIDVDDSFGFHVNGGLEVFITDDAAINLDMKYVWEEVDVDNNFPGSDEEFKRNQFVAGVGLKYYF